MTDNFESAQTDPSKSGGPLLAGAIELTPEARAILTKQVNRRIVWGHKFAKGGLFVLCSLPLLVSVFFGYGFVAAGINSVPVALVAALLVGGPIVLTWFFGRLVSKL
jgi:hypothetical protein